MAKKKQQIDPMVFVASASPYRESFDWGWVIFPVVLLVFIVGIWNVVWWGAPRVWGFVTLPWTVAELKHDLTRLEWDSQHMQEMVRYFVEREAQKIK